LESEDAHVCEPIVQQKVETATLLGPTSPKYYITMSKKC